MSLQILSIKNSCCGCGACYNTCPLNAILMEPDNEGFIYPSVVEQKCVNCGKCEKVCPILTNADTPQLLQKAYYGWINDEEVRKKSSSGGAFTAIANYVLFNNGIVIGAVYDNSLKKVVHKSTDHDISKQRKSKYVESDTLNTFSETRQYLENERHVLYCGTPCQIAGLKSFLGKPYDKLITVDFICHGVPPMKLLNEHIRTIEEKYKSNVISFDFRPKHNGWSQHYLKLLFCNNNHYTKPYVHDNYFKAFMSNVCLRKACFNCKFDITHLSDITIADFWHIYTYNPKINDEKGISLIHINTQIGDAVLKNTRAKMNLYDISWDDARYCLKPKNTQTYNINKRNEFMEKVEELGFEKAVKKYLRKGMWIDRIKWFIKEAIYLLSGWIRYIMNPRAEIQEVKHKL